MTVILLSKSTTARKASNQGASMPQSTFAGSHIRRVAKQDAVAVRPGAIEVARHKLTISARLHERKLSAPTAVQSAPVSEASAADCL